MTIDRKRPETAVSPADTSTAPEAMPEASGLSARERAQEKLRQLREAGLQARKERDERDAEAYFPLLDQLRDEPLVTEFPDAPPNVVGTVICRRASDMNLKVFNEQIAGKKSDTLSLEAKNAIVKKLIFSCLVWPSPEELKALYEAVPYASGEILSKITSAAQGDNNKGKG